MSQDPKSYEAQDPDGDGRKRGDWFSSELFLSQVLLLVFKTKDIKKDRNKVCVICE